MCPITYKNAKGRRFVFVMEAGTWSVTCGVSFETLAAGFQSVKNAERFAEAA